MHKQRFLLAALLAALIPSIGAMAPGHSAAAEPAQRASGASKPAPTTINVTTTVYDFDASGAEQLLMRSDDYNGTGQATYTTIDGCGSTPCLFSGINSKGAWQLNLYRQSVRTLWITPNVAIDGSQPAGPPAGYYWQNVEAYCQCYDQSGNIVPFQNLSNGSNNCSLGVVFHYPNGSSQGAKYKLVMSPHLPAAGPATGLASVACNAVSSGQCVNWTITPNTAAANATVADLYYYNNKGALVFVGQYYNTFRINASNP
ncbi:MAG TPA: hypothetical protein VLG74_15570 [Blastocatellia bacterium]|nr:hypothetical protein [Blastocatellia bacterium]